MILFLTNTFETIIDWITLDNILDFSKIVFQVIKHSILFILALFFVGLFWYMVMEMFSFFTCGC